MPQVKVNEKTTRKRKTAFKLMMQIVAISVVISAIAGIYGSVKALPAGISYESDVVMVDDLEFLYDLTYETSDGATVHDQQIFNRAFDMIDKAQGHIMVDMFLFNNEYDRSSQYPNLSEDLANKLVDKKKQDPGLPITVITDPINTFYGSYPSVIVDRLEENDIEVVFTDLTELRDSNPAFSGFWRVFLQWFGTEGDGWIANAFSPDSPDVTLRSYVELLNFKANHRKVLITDDRALVTSANPHDASAYHSNIAFVVSGGLVEDITKSEQAVANFSGGNMEIAEEVFSNNNPAIEKKEVASVEKQHVPKAKLITEGKIEQQIVEELQLSGQHDTINLGMFYLSDRTIIKELLAAADRGANVRIILDPNKDAFGREKNGIPNRSVAKELIEKSEGKIDVRWYDTDGEQFHTKLLMIERNEEIVAIGGSANYTKRNLGDRNLETDIAVWMPHDSEVATKMKKYFDKLWKNNDGNYTTNDEEYQPSGLDGFIYRFQEWSGLSTF